MSKRRDATEFYFSTCCRPGCGTRTYYSLYVHLEEYGEHEVSMCEDCQDRFKALLDKFEKGEIG